MFAAPLICTIFVAGKIRVIEIDRAVETSYSVRTAIAA
jgi:hypothetical protein